MISGNNAAEKRTYYYRKNIQGDITHITDDNGHVKAEYIYDAWGNHEIIKNEDNIGLINPFRYRGYYFDIETGLYYLKARYYDPETGRFINADSIGVFDETRNDINGLNLYAYCANNPVMLHDPTGQLFGWIKKAVNAVGNWIHDNKEIILTVSVIAAVIALTVATAGVGGIVAGAVGGGLMGSIIGGAVGGAIAGAIFGAGLSIVSQGLSNGYGNIDWGSVGMATLTGAVTGAALGGIFGGMGGVAGAGAKVATAGGTASKATNVTIRTVRNSELTKAAQTVRAGLAKNVQGHTISNMKAGQQIHAGFRVGHAGKEKTLIGYGRVDVLTKKAIIELKPNNPNAIADGIKQLQRYNGAFGGKLKMILVLY
jgi:RHS repeat-associated protein